MSLVAQWVLCFLGTAAAGILCAVPRKALIPCGLLGTVAFFSALWLEKADMSSVAASFLAAFLTALLSEVLARAVKLPASCFAVPGVIPLAPGVTAYRAMYAYVLDQPDTGTSLAVNTLLVAAAISAGLVMAGSLCRLVAWPTFHRATQQED